MANKDLRNRTSFSNAVDTQLLNSLKDYSKESGIPISKLLDNCIKMYLESIKK